MPVKVDISPMIADSSEDFPHPTAPTTITSCPKDQVHIIETIIQKNKLYQLTSQQKIGR